MAVTALPRMMRATPLARGAVNNYAHGGRASAGTSAPRIDPWKAVRFVRLYQRYRPLTGHPVTGALHVFGRDGQAAHAAMRDLVAGMVGTFLPGGSMDPGVIKGLALCYGREVVENDAIRFASVYKRTTVIEPDIGRYLGETARQATTGGKVPDTFAIHTKLDYSLPPPTPFDVERPTIQLKVAPLVVGVNNPLLRGALMAEGSEHYIEGRQLPPVIRRRYRIPVIVVHAVSIEFIDPEMEAFSDPRLARFLPFQLHPEYRQHFGDYSQQEFLTSDEFAQRFRP